VDIPLIIRLMTKILPKRAVIDFNTCLREVKGENIIMPSIWKKVKRAINDFLVKLAQENQKSYGSGRLDCCNLNKNDNASKRSRG